MAKRPRILTIDDSRAVQIRYFELLQSIEAEIDTANNGEEGLEKALARKYDLIITDVRMPKMTGIELCHALQNVPKTRNTPVIIISDFASERDIDNGFEAGATAYLSKRDVQSHLLQTVSKCLWKSSYRPKRIILVVDDSQAIQRFVEFGLHQTGFEVLTAMNGKEALAVLTKRKPDLILSDISMPVMDGVELCKELYHSPKFSSIPFVVMSASDDRIHMNRIMQYGAAAFVAKPFSLDSLIDQIDRILSDNFLSLLQERDRLYAERAQLYQAGIDTVDTLEAKDPYSQHHSSWVAKTATEMLILTGAPPADIEMFRQGARLHNIGMVGIRDSILLKPWKLSDAEFEHVKQHPKLGRTIMEPVASLSPILPIIYSHHERWDGSGYPDGLKGEDIPFWARIVAVADTYHALTHNRPFRSALPDIEALDILRETRGTTLCPRCIDLFFDYHQKRRQRKS